MSDPRRVPDDRPPNDALGLLEGIQALQGEELPIDQDAVLEPTEIEPPRQPTLTEIDSGAPEELPDDVIDPAVIDPLVADRIRADETDDPTVATEEGLPWIPPSDPPIVPDPESPDGFAVAAGFASSADAEPYDDDHRRDEDIDGLELSERVRDAIRADGSTSDLVDAIRIVTHGDRVILRGTVLTVDDADALVAVAQRVDGIADVVDQTELAS